MAIFDRLTIEMISAGDSINIENGLDSDDAEKLVKSKALTRIQSQGMLNTETLKVLNEQVLRFRSDIELRFYCLAKDPLDLSFLEHISNVTRLSIDNANEAFGYEAFSYLKSIEHLKVNIHSLSNIEFLQLINKNLRSLRLYRSSSKKPDLSILKRFNQLESLYIQGHKKNIESLKSLKSLNSLSLSGMTLNDLSFLNQIPSLRELSLNLINKESLTSLEELNSIVSLNVTEIRSLADLSFLEGMKSLKFLHLSYLNLVENLPSLGAAKTLQVIYMNQMKAITDLSQVSNCKALRSFHFSSRCEMLPEDFESIIRLPKIESIHT